ncbi:MAG: deoxyribodipyrimidine photolyase [Myxococcota bacterium]
MTPAYRITRLDGGDEDFAPGAYILYWMIAARRPRANFALQRAVELAARARLPLVVFEPLRVGYAHASDRFHRFAIEGMVDHADHFAAHGVRYVPYVERQEGEGKGMLEALAARAAAVVTDDYPCFFLPRMVAAAAERLDRPFEAVDGNGLYPMRDTDRHFTRAHSFRRHLQKRLPAFLGDQPLADPLAGYEGGLADIDDAVGERWPIADASFLREPDLSDLPIDHAVRPAKEKGGFLAAEAKMKGFFDARFSRYADGRNHPDDTAASGLSPWLHWGHLGAHEVFAAIVEREEWTVENLGKVNGSREGWWGMGGAAEAFLDELITWREVGFNACVNLPAYDRYESLPDWARKTLSEHAEDDRPELYEIDALENAETGDDIWNAAQRQLTREGRIHNYLRMLWGKKILQWSRSAEVAAERMVYLNDKYALDGRDPNSYSGIYWVLGRYDRAWGPERPIFGKIRYMTSDSTRRKLKLRDYLEAYSA